MACESQLDLSLSSLYLEVYLFIIFGHSAQLVGC